MNVLSWLPVIPIVDVLKKLAKLTGKVNPVASKLYDAESVLIIWSVLRDIVSEAVICVF